ncbi:metallophosphoesterase family protein [Edaphobacillus lindanitolerans]|uniref:Phosphoesterase n=1 Tax=Edaphobacillus lindanitolerans TaxID=550447 RepID=A0A1U7PNG8_9BACI|nr:metallophosphoesterase family protein [Edaphobacillus lindanitolerans]SIT84586.1 hypothetical protein SAMN05428946_1738 [Edaphobacillus lindanitolerans]
MKIIITGDTHMPRMAKKLPPPLLEELETADHIIHTGDWQTPEVYDELARFAPVDGVSGNADPPELRERFGQKKTITLGGVRIGIVHGDGKGKTTPRRALDAFMEDPPDLILFGHSHIPMNENHDGTILFNPGSPTDKRRQPRFSFGILETGAGTPEPRHVFYDSKI